MQKKDKKDTIWIISTIILIIISCGLTASVTIYIDPLFHYHEPLAEYEYPLNNDRYQNDGITRNFDYDGIITGSSMVANFMTSEAKQIFDADFIKVPFFGGTYKEINDNLLRAFDSGKNIRYVINCLDYSRLIQDKDAYRTDIDYPTYLYNDIWLDDVSYILNKEILFNQTRNVVKYTKAGNKTTNFDDYLNWNANYTFGAETVMSTYTLGEKMKEERTLTENESTMVLENIRQNVTELAYAHPETVFYLFFPPYSICYWDDLHNKGQVNWRIDAEQIAIREILRCPNINLYSFCDNFGLICNLNNYKDSAHYGEWVNSWILQQMNNDIFLLTEDNYVDYIKKIREFYNSFDYESLHK